jgi:hypothetical protein
MNVYRKIRWKIACLADDIRNIRRRLHYWYVGPPGRHSYDTAQMLAIEADLASRPWPLDAAPAPLSLRPPAPGPELPPDDGYAWNPAAAVLRATAPRLFAPDDEYWGLRRVEFYGQIAWDTAEANRVRRECGLPPRPLAPPQIRELKAA